MAQRYALSELTLENKLVDERQKSAQLDNRIANQVEKNNQLHNFQQENLRQENNQLKSEVSILRHRLQSKSIAFHDLSCSLDEEKYKNLLLSEEKEALKNRKFIVV